MLKPIKPDFSQELVEQEGLVFIEIAKEQEEYQTLPAYYNPQEGIVITAWELSDDDRRAIAEGAELFLAIWTGGRPLQPLFPCVVEKELQEVGALSKDRSTEEVRVQADVEPVRTQDQKSATTRERPEAESADTSQPEEKE